MVGRGNYERWHRHQSKIGGIKMRKQFVRDYLVEEMAEDIKLEYPNYDIETVEDYLACGNENFNTAEKHLLLELLNL